jgi:hypothetical protein
MDEWMDGVAQFFRFVLKGVGLDLGVLVVAVVVVLR